MGASRIYVLLVHGTCTSYKANGMYVCTSRMTPGDPGPKVVCTPINSLYLMYIHAE
jgi:hypothetical protein